MQQNTDKIRMACACTIGEEWTEDGQEYRSQAFKKRAKNVEGKVGEAVEESTSEEKDDSDDLDSIEEDDDEEEEELDYSAMSTERSSSITYLDDGRALVKYYLPWAEVVVDFHDRVKNLTSG